jgi:hypothetical protein
MRLKLRTALTFSLRDWLLLAQAWILLLVVEVGLRMAPFQRVQAWAAGARRSTASLDPQQELAAIQRVQRMVDLAGRRHLYPMTCLRRALVLQRLLARRGISTELRFGAHKEAGELSAHAWLEHAGLPIGEPQTITERFAPLDTQKATP